MVLLSQQQSCIELQFNYKNYNLAVEFNKLSDIFEQKLNKNTDFLLKYLKFNKGKVPNVSIGMRSIIRQ